MLLLVHSEPNRYRALIFNVKNRFTRNLYGYPTIISGAYDILVNYRSPTGTRFKMQDDGIAFLSDTGNNQDDTGRGDRGG